MNICPVSKLPVREKPEWSASHLENGYTTLFKCIGEDIIHMKIESRTDVTLANIDAKRFHEVLSELNLTDKSIYLMGNFEHVRKVSYRYKKDFLNFLFNWGSNIRLVVLYNIHPDIAIDIDTFGAISTEQTRLFHTGNYREAMEKLTAFKNGKLSPTSIDPPGNKTYEQLKREFLAFTARISLLQMTTQQINLPPKEHSLYPFFMGIKNLQQDLNAMDIEHQLSLEKLKTDYEENLSKKNIQLNAEIALKKLTTQDFEQEKIALKGKISSLEMEIARMTSAVNKKIESLNKLCSTIHLIDIDPKLKNTILNQCHDLIDKETDEQRYNNIPMTETDSEFLLKLQKDHPGLNQRELKLALMVKMNYNNTQIAHALGVSKRGSESIRYRMHKKMGLEKHQSIKTCLLELTTRK